MFLYLLFAIVVAYVEGIVRDTFICGFYYVISHTWANA